MRTWYQQECIPVGCVPSAAVAISEGAVRPEVSAQGCLPGGGGVCLRGVFLGRSAQGVYTPLSGQNDRPF